jgi:uncharacterized protein (TIGR03435 family)
MTDGIARRLALGKTILLTTIGAVAICGPTVVGFLNAQQPKAHSAVPNWDVVSVKRCVSNIAGSATTGARGSTVERNPRRLDLPCSTATRLIVMSYFDFADGQVNANTVPLPIDGGPAWINSEFYKITAVADGDASPAVMRGPMMRAILEDRFKLKVHRETKEMPTFTLTVAKGGLKIHPIKEGDCQRDRSSRHYAVVGTGVYTKPLSTGDTRTALCDSWNDQMMVGPNRIIDFYGSSLSYFSQRLRDIVGRPVIDETGVDGLFNLHIEFAPDGTTPKYNNEQSAFPLDVPAGTVVVSEQTRQRIEAQVARAKDPTGPSFFAALEQQLGLKLSSSRGAGEIFIIDHIERPTRN